MKTHVKILVVDDQSDIGEVVCEILYPHYGNIKFLSDPAQATALIKSEKYTLLITDEEMPALAGHQVVELLRSEKNMIPTLFLTGQDPEKMLGIAKNLKPAGILQKPFEPEELLQAVEALLSLPT